MYKSLIILMITCANFASLIDTNKTWSMMYGPSIECSHGVYYCKSYRIKAIGDTFVEGYTYKKIMSNNDSSGGLWALTGLIREEGDKVYKLDLATRQSCMLYDFGVEPGDSLLLNCTYCESSFVVDSVSYSNKFSADSVVRKVIYLRLTDMGSEEIWVEGVGSLFGLLNAGAPHCLIGGGKTLLCCFINDRLAYHANGYDVCYLHPDKIEEGVAPYVSSPGLTVYPNPFNPVTIIEYRIETMVKGILTLYNGSGARMFAQDVRGQGRVSWNTTGLASGTYLVRLVAGGKTFQKKMALIR